MRTCDETVRNTLALANVIADSLSHRYQPGKAFTVPLALVNVPEVTLPPRDESYYRTLVIPPESIMAQVGAENKLATLRARYLQLRQTLDTSAKS